MGKKYKVKNLYFDIEPHEVFLDKLAHDKEDDLGLSEKKFEVPIKERISYVFFTIFIILSIVLFYKTFDLQFLNGKSLAIEAENNKGSVNLVVPTRGIIYDKNMKKLVLNSPAYDLVCMPIGRQVIELGRSYDAIDVEIKKIAGILKVDEQEILQKFQNIESSEILIADKLSHDNILIFEARIKEFPDCKISQNTIRGYVYGPVLSQVLGYTGRINKSEYISYEGYSINDYMGKSGIEKNYEQFLRGKAGQAKSPISTKEANQVSDFLLAPEPGNNLVLNIDLNLQKRIYDSLEKSIKNVGVKRGAAVAMDPRTGAVLAMVSYPSYDDNLFSGGISFVDYNKLQNDPNNPLLNRAIQAHYPTGSIIKPLEASAALQERIISSTKLINDPGYILVQSKYDPDIVYTYRGVKPNGLVDMRKAIAVSSNVYFYTVGGGYEDQEGLGPARIKKYLSLYGWDQKTGIDLPGEFSGFIPDPAWKKSTKGQSWWDGDTYNLSIGQSDLQTTPLQVATAYCAIANGGTLYKPQVLDKVIDNSGNVIKDIKPQIIRNNFIDAENLKIVREGMRDAVSKPYGLSTYLNDLPVKVAAKTGTAEIGYKDRFNVWSSVFAPYDDPQIVLVVTVENVQGLGAVTLPVAHEALEWYFNK
jgi:penicillin-binding protein 2